MKWFWSKPKKTENEKLDNGPEILKAKLEAIRLAEEKEKRKHNIRHALYDTSKAVVGFFRRLFTKKITKADEIRKAGDKELVKRETVFLGGTKPMSQYTASDGSQWLAKQAVNCMGYYKLSGVLLTVAGANVQKLVDPNTAVKAYRGKTIEDGEISLQQKIDNTISSKDFDLFKFTKHPEFATDSDLAIVEGLGDQILREHVTDWLLCNFDTKGENFLISAENSKFKLIGIDKEAAFSKLKDPNAQYMSTTYKPHANNTLYNTVFEMYKQGKMDLNLDTMKEKINEIVRMDSDEYMKNYSDYLEHERKSNPTTYADTYMKIRERKQNLGEEYNRFFTDLVRARIEAKPEEAEKLRERYFNGGDRCTLFEPKDISPRARAMDIITRTREDAFARILSGGATPQNLAPFMVAQGLEVRLNQASFEDLTDPIFLNNFSGNAIANACTQLKNDRTILTLASEIKSGRIDLSDVKTTEDFSNKTQAFFKSNILGRQMDGRHTIREKSATPDQESRRATI